MRRRILALGVVVAVATASCSSATRSADPPVTTVPAPTTTTLPPGPDPDVVPAVITPAYVDAVFKVLNHINGNAVRELEATHSIDTTVSADLKAIYGGPLLPVEMQVFSAGLSENTSNLRNPIGDRLTTVRSLIHASADCIFASTSSSLSAVELRQTATAASEYWELVPKPAAQKSTTINPTPWLLTYNQDFTVPTVVSDPCEGK